MQTMGGIAMNEAATHRLRAARKVGAAASLTYDHREPIRPPLTDGQSNGDEEEKRAWHILQQVNPVAACGVRH